MADLRDQPRQRYSLERQPDGTIVIKVAIPTQDVERVRARIVEELVKQVELPGFRKGAAPRKIAEQKLNKQAVREEILKKILSEEYASAIKHLSINPIVNPKIHVEQFEEGTNLEFTAETCEEPEIKLNNYKDEIKKLTAASKIIIPGKEEKSADAIPGSTGKIKLDQILSAALSATKITIPKILIEQETDRLLSQLLDEIKKLGLSLEQYLASRNKTGELLRTEYAERAERDLKLEFMLRKIADDEKITVEQAEIEKAISGIKDEKQKNEISKNPYLVAAIIRQQKTLDYLSKI